jgi:hypothetical protein
MAGAPDWTDNCVVQLLRVFSTLHFSISRFMFVLSFLLPAYACAMPVFTLAPVISFHSQSQIIVPNLPIRPPLFHARTTTSSLKHVATVLKA